MGPLSHKVIMADTTEEEKKMVEMFRLKRLIQNLESARGNGTSMITLIAPPGDQISQLTRLLTDEQGSASNIKSRVNRLSVLSAITSALQRLKQMSSVPENGLALFTGNVVLSDGKEKKVTYVIEPHRPLNTSLYMCDSRFHVDALRDLLSNDDSFGFIIVDGNGVLYGKLTGNHKETLHKYTVELPKKHGRGGQSAVRFARLRMEARHNYVRKVAEHAVQHFITNDRPNVQGIILAGSADFKNELAKSDLFDPRLLEVVIKTVDISYGGEAGFAQAIELSAESLANVALVKEKKLLAEYFEHIALDTNKITYGIKDTMMGLEMGAVETLIIWEDLEIDRIVLVDPASGSETIKFLNKEQQELIEWLANNYSNFGASLKFVTDRSQEGSQFCKGFGGVGGILRYQLDFAAMEYHSSDWDSDSDEYSSDEGGI